MISFVNMLQCKNFKLDSQFLDKKLTLVFSADANTPMRYVFISNFCGDDIELNVYQTLVIPANGEGHSAAFSIEAFSFKGGSGELYLH